MKSKKGSAKNESRLYKKYTMAGIVNTCVFVVALFFSCNTSKYIADELKQKAASDWKGKIPCADCEGISYTLSLMSNGLFTEQSVYLGKNTTPFSASGTWKINRDSVINLHYNEGNKRYLVFTNDYLELMDAQGTKIISSFPQRMRLYKYDANKNDALAAKWALLKIGSRNIDSVAYPHAVPTLEFQLNESRAYGFGGCNRFSGSIRIDEDQIIFSSLISTRMACTGPNVEDEYLKILSGNTFAYTVSEGTLYLRKDDTTLTFIKAE
jgi:heat shock protein HslJ